MESPGEIEQLRHQCQCLERRNETHRLENTLLLNQYTANKQAFAECSRMQIHENALLKNEIQMQKMQIQSLQESKRALEMELAATKQAKDAQEKNTKMANEFLQSLSSCGQAKLELMYANEVAKVQSLTMQLERAQIQSAKAANGLAKLKAKTTRDLERIYKLVESADVFEMLRLWIECDELKLDYYEHGEHMVLEEIQKLTSKIAMAQEELKIAILIARGAWLDLKTRLLDELLCQDAAQANSDCVSNSILPLAQLVLQRLDWVFSAYPLSNKELVDQPELLSEVLARAKAPVWFCRANAAQALEPL
ncbi:hypothetical protein BdWA1_001397 [Babesia duncani]|uniref:Uncharacterized protein n=1 Tax=Babesia duncani TaxID=323732 RepID=A0AAD9UQX2_9APIC|nr:hypothetical protein BdWA1_001397 [Babesia duncani]